MKNEHTFNIWCYIILHYFRKTTGPQVCPDLQTKVYQCYQANPDQTLECSSVVRAFVDCVERARQVSFLYQVQYIFSG